MPSFQTLRLEDCLDELIDYRGKSPEKSLHGIPVLSAKVVKTSGLIEPIEQKVAPEYYKRWMTRGFPRPGDVVFTTEGPLGEVLQLDDRTAEFALGQRIVCLRGRPEVLDNTYLRYLLASPTQQAVLQSFATGTTVLGISQKALRSVPVTLPDFENQVQIGATLKSLDDKIELNRKTNETLEAMAQAIFRDWFVDFGPVRRKTEGASDPFTILGGLLPEGASNAAHIASLFPDRLSDDGLPEGWKRRPLQQIARLNPASWTAKRHPEEVEYVDLSNTKWGTIQSTELLSWADAPSRARRIVQPDDCIMATTRPGNGSFAFISQEGLTASTGFAVLRPKHKRYVNSVYLAVTQKENIQRLASLADGHGGAYPAVNPSTVLDTEITLAQDAVYSAIESVLNPIRKLIEQRKLENIDLAKMRDLLLPQLMSGAVQVMAEAGA